MRALLLAIAVLALAPASAVAAPTLGPDGKTAPVHDYLQAVRERVFILQPGIDQDRNGVADRITIDIIRPATADPVPAIIDPSPYYTTICRGNDNECMGDMDGDGVNDLWPMFVDNYFVPRGYAYILAQMNGTGYTTHGCPHHGGAGDIAGMKSVVDWLRGRATGVDANGNPKVANWDNGSSAMIGKSYDGTLANGVAATGVEGLKTIVPISAISDWYAYSRWGGITQSSNYPTFLNNAITYSAAPRPGVSLPDRRPLCTAVNNDFNVWDGDDTGDYNAFWDERDYTGDADQVEAAVLAVHGFQDDNVRMDHLWRWWHGIEAAGVPRKLWLLRSGHTDPFDSRRAAWVDVLHRWFDRWLYDVDNGVEDGPPVTIEDERDVWNDYASWPLPGTADVPLWLQGTTLSEPGVLRPASGGPLDSLSFTSPSSLNENNAINDPSTLRTYRRVFLSRPLTRDLRLSGRAVMELRGSLSTTQSNLGAFLVDYSSTPFQQVTRNNDGTQDVNGSETKPENCWGTPGAHDRACFREIAKPLDTVTRWRVTRGFLDSSNRSSLRTASPVTIGQSYDFPIPMQPTEHIFKAGHQIGIVIVGNQFGVAGTPNATITVDTKLSRVQLPIVGGAAAARAAGLTDETAPTTTASATEGGWSRSRTLMLTADDGDGSGAAEITYSTSGAVTQGPITVAGSTATVALDADGATTVRFSSRDRVGHVEPEKTLTVQVDSIAPTVSFTPPSTSTFARGAVVETSFACADDGGSGVASCPAGGRLDTATAGARELAYTATDMAGNAHTATWPYTVLGRLPKMTVKRRAGSGLKLALTSRVDASARVTVTLRKGGKRVRLKAKRVTLAAGKARTVKFAVPARMRRGRAEIRVSAEAGALKRADLVKLKL